MASTSTDGLGFSTPPDQLPPSAAITHLRYEGLAQESSEGMICCLIDEETGAATTTKIKFSEDGNRMADDQGNTWLHIGAGAGNDQMVCGFIAKGGKDLNIDIRNGKDETPFMLAARAGNLKIAEILFANGADIDAFVRNESPEVVRSTTALTLAAKENEIHMVRFLLKNRVNVAEDAAGFTPLYYVLGEANLEVVGALIDGGCSPHYLTRKDWNSLHFAAQNSDPEVVRMLVAVYKVNPNQKNTEGLLPLHYADNPDVKRVLLENGTVLDSKDLIELLSLNASKKAVALPEDGKILESAKSCPSTSFTVKIVREDAGLPPISSCLTTKTFSERGSEMMTHSFRLGGSPSAPALTLNIQSHAASSSSSHAASSVPPSTSSSSTPSLTGLAFDVDTTTPLELIQAHADAISDPTLQRSTQSSLYEILRILNVRFPGNPITMSSTLEKHNGLYKLSIYAAGDGTKCYKVNILYTLSVDDSPSHMIRFTNTIFSNAGYPRDPKQVLLLLQAYMQAVQEIATPAAERTHLVIRPDQEYDMMRVKNLTTRLNKDPLSGEYTGIKSIGAQGMDITLNWIEDPQTSRHYPRAIQIGRKTYRSEFDWIEKGAPYIVEGIHEIEVERIQAGVLSLEKFFGDVGNKEKNLKGIVNNSFMQFNGVFGSRDSSDVATYAAFPSAYEAVHAAWDSEPKSAVDASRWESVSKVKAYVNAYNRKFQNIPNIFERLERQLVELYETMSDRIADVRKAYNELKEMRYAVDKLIANRIRVPEKVISQLRQTSQRLQATETSIEELFGRLGLGSGEEEAFQGISKQISSAGVVTEEYFNRTSFVTGASSSTPTPQHYEPQQGERAVRMPNSEVNWSKDPENTFKEMIESGQFVSEQVILQEVELLKREFAENQAVVRWVLPDGEWIKGTLEGEGAQIHPTGIVKKGKFVKGNLVEGWSFFPDGHWIQGTFRGEGVRIQSSKVIERGLFICGKLVSGELINGPEHLVGDFTGEGFTGEGSRIYSGTRLTGRFEKDKLIEGISTSFATGIEITGTFEGYGRRKWTDLRASEKRIAGWNPTGDGVVEVGKFENSQLVEGTWTNAEGEIREYKRVNGRVEIITLHKPGEGTCSLQ